MALSLDNVACVLDHSPLEKSEMAAEDPGSEVGAAIQKLVHLAKLAESVERYDDMAQYMRQIVTMADNTCALNIEQRNLFSVAFKNVVASKRLVTASNQTL